MFFYLKEDNPLLVPEMYVPLVLMGLPAPSRLPLEWLRASSAMSSGLHAIRGLVII